MIAQGMGGVTLQTKDFSLDQTVSDLNAVLEKARMDKPVIIVAHSVGGVYARHFINQHPDKVAGLILVDTRNEFFKDDSTEEYNDAFFNSQGQSTNKILARLGAIRLFGEKTLKGMHKFVSTEKYANVQYDAPFFKVLDEEIKQIPENVDRLKELQPLKNMPLTIITPEVADTQAVELGFSSEQEKTLNKKWFNAQRGINRTFNK